MSNTVDAGRIRGDRTRIYTGGLEPNIPAGIATGTCTAETVAGQSAVLSAVNMLARAHPALALRVPDVPLAIPCPTGGRSLIEACRLLATAANPDVTLMDGFPDDILSIGIGRDAGTASIYAGGDRWTASTSTTKLAVTDHPSTLIGAGMAVARAAAWIFRMSIGLEANPEGQFSLWTFEETLKGTGPTICGPLDIGSVWLVGAGAVGSSLAWWLNQIGVIGDWTVIDKDLADISNLNRGLGLFADGAGWFSGSGEPKSVLTSRLIPGATPFTGWWHDWVASDPLSPDVLIPTANDHGVRPTIAVYSHPTTIHATTSRQWTAELHRHLLDRDGCIACRLPEATPRFECSTADVLLPQGERIDAALSFLSGGAGLLLAAGLLQLQHGHLATHEQNHWRIWFEPTVTPITTHRHTCLTRCTAIRTPALRERLHRGTRWSHLDPEILKLSS